MSSRGPNIDTDLRNRLRFETMLADLSSKFVDLESCALDREIENAQQEVCECLGLDVSALWQRTAEGPDAYVLTHLHRSLGGPPVPDVVDAKDYFPWCLSQIVSGGFVCLRSLNDAPPEATRDREVWDHYGIKSVLGIPLSRGGAVVGVLTFDSMREEQHWPDVIVQRLRLVAQVFANALAHRHSDALLRQSEERLQLAAESGGVGMWMLDLEQRRFWVTDRAREIFGYEPGTEVTMTRFLDSVCPEDHEPVEDAVRLAADDGREIDIEYRISVPGRGERWVQSRGRRQPAESGLPLRLLGASVDVTERRRAEEELKGSLEQVQQLRSRLEAENAYLKKERRLQSGSARIVGESPAIQEVLNLVELVAPTRSSVLIHGETGTGKELIARRIHEHSPRRDRPMVKVNCAALPSTLVESELFGREKGAYTGAVSRELGRFEVADGSTLFLDEIAELPLELQAKLLRVLEEGRFERLGSSRTLTTDVRVIAATNRDLPAEVAAGRFRRDLYFRLAVFPIQVPPLRDRRGDLPLLVWSIVHELSSGMNKAVETIESSDMESLDGYEWPGNVRELRNVVERALPRRDTTGLAKAVARRNRELLRFELMMEFDPVDRPEATGVLRSLLGPVRSEPGCCGTRLLSDAEDERLLTWVEEWRDPFGFEEHLRAGAFRQIIAVMEMASMAPVVKIDEIASRRGFDFVEEILGRASEHRT